MNYLVEIITALGIGGVLTKVVDYLIERSRKAKEKKESFTKVFQRVHEVYYTLMMMLRDTSAHRIVLLKTTNGGGRPTISGKLYGSVIYEAFEMPLGSKKQFWQKQMLDTAYVNMLFEMNKKGFLEVQTSTMAPGILKDLYQKDDIVHAWIFKIAEREKEYIYLSANFTQKPVESPDTRDVFRIGVSKLKQLFATEIIY